MSNNIKDLGDGNRHPKIYWDALRRIRNGLGNSYPLPRMCFKKPDGTPCITGQENGEVVKNHFQKVYNINPSVDFSAINSLVQRPLKPELDNTFTDEEFRKALHAASKDKAAGDCQVPAKFWQALDGDPSTACLLRKFVDRFWISEAVADEWRVNRLKLLPKKGDLHDLNN